MKKHINDFMRLQCAPDIMALKLFPNAKEITESMGVFAAVERVLVGEEVLSLTETNVALVSVGDGATPRTAGLFAFRTHWQCYSIDPNLNQARDWEHCIQRLRIERRRVEDETLDLRAFDHVVIAMVHSHAPMKETLKHVLGRVRHVVALPCCVPMEIPSRPYFGLDDHNIWSPKHTIKLWTGV